MRKPPEGMVLIIIGVMIYAFVSGSNIQWSKVVQLIEPLALICLGIFVFCLPIMALVIRAMRNAPIHK